MIINYDYDDYIWEKFDGNYDPNHSDHDNFHNNYVNFDDGDGEPSKVISPKRVTKDGDDDVRCQWLEKKRMFF